MKFKIGDKIDSAQCITLTHTFFRCIDSFNEFRFLAENMINGNKNSNWLSYKTYNAYADFILHLHSFLEGCLARENNITNIQSTKTMKAHQIIDNYINAHVLRILEYKRQDIINNNAPAWENDISYYSKEQFSLNFASEFRIYRNKIDGHVAYERAHILNLSQFYSKYHKYLYLLYQDSYSHWGKIGQDFPDLADITNFTVLVKNENLNKLKE